MKSQSSLTRFGLSIGSKIPASRSSKILTSGTIIWFRSGFRGLLVYFRLTLRLSIGLRAILPRLRGNPDTVIGSFGVALGSIVALPSTFTAMISIRSLLA